MKYLVFRVPKQNTEKGKMHMVKVWNNKIIGNYLGTLTGKYPLSAFGMISITSHAWKE